MSVNEEMMKNNLRTVQVKIDMANDELSSLHEQRQSVIGFCYDNGMSVISIAQALNMTRQRVYKILDAKEEEEVQIA